jgi:hypothetical protein
MKKKKKSRKKSGVDYFVQLLLKFVAMTLAKSSQQPAIFRPRVIFLGAW